MESTILGLNSHSWDSEIKFPSPTDLKEIKQMLLSGDKEQILQSTEKIKDFISNEDSMVELLRSDISEFLCDAITPFDEVSVRALSSCLECMAKHVEFFSHSHSCFTIESLIRSIYFLMKNSCSSTSLGQCLNLLVLIVQGYSTYSVTPEKKTVRNLLQLLPKLLKGSVTTANNKYQIGHLILALANLKIKWNFQNFETILESFYCWFNLLSDIFETVHPLKENVILLCCMLCHSVLRFIVSKNNSLEEFNVDVHSTYKNGVILKISHFLINVGAPYFDNLPLTAVESDPSKMECFFQTILYFFSDDVPQKSQITHGLGEMGFLQFTTRVISFVDFSHCQKLRKLCTLVLSYMILSLSEDVFQFSEVWPNGSDDFQNEIHRGISQLPSDVSHWLDILANPRSSDSCKIALLLYLYFYAMTAKSEIILESIYPSIASFINFSLGFESPVLLVKTVWFIYVMSQLSNSQVASSESEFETTDKMVSVLEVQRDLAVVYTHHPALLYWAFSSKVNGILQPKIVYLWLKNKTPDCKELEDLVGKSSDVIFVILDILQNESGPVLESAFLTLKSIMIKTENDELATNIWFLLPQVLAKYTADSTSATNVDYVIELSCLKTPKSLDITKVIRIASLLPEVLIKSDLMSLVPSLALTFQLLQLGFQMDDLRIMQFFLRFDGFLQKIMEGMKIIVCDISVHSLKVITLLWNKCKEFNKTEEYKKIKFNKEIILKALENNRTEVLSVALEFLQEVLLTGFRSPIFEIEHVDSGFIEILFFEVQNLCFKNVLETSSNCWRCLKSFLTLELVKPEFEQIELATNPLLYEIINFHLPNLEKSPEMKEFLNVWLDRNNKKLDDCCFTRKIFGKLYLETVRNIACCLEQNLCQENRTLYEKVLKHGRTVSQNKNEKWRGKIFNE